MEFPIDMFQTEMTPFYYYDLSLLDKTISTVQNQIDGMPICVHYAIKANSDNVILNKISRAGFGADCVSIGEVKVAIVAGFSPDKIVFAGVCKTDQEIKLALKYKIGCFNVESVEELTNIASIASECGAVAPVALRVNPNIDAHTHHYITTGLEENKFGIDLNRLDDAVHVATTSSSLKLLGLHFHIGSQILSMEPYIRLSHKINELQSRYERDGVAFSWINTGGGLGIDYDTPDEHPIADFSPYFRTLLNNLDLRPGQTVHCELGRSIVAQCGSLISRVVYVKSGEKKQFIILDGGMNCLIRPALYDAHHFIQNLTAEADGRSELRNYDVVGPICESSDVFATDEILPVTRRGDIVALRSAGAYGESMASNYNLRPLYPSKYSQ